MKDHTKTSSWKGYTYDELKFRRILTTTKIELEKNVIAERIDNIKGGHMFSNKGGWLTKAAGALDYVDYAAIAYGIGKRLIRLFHHKK
ncbi:MAG: hypothetical protein LIP09_10190 [Bacteroidales bacterium]|nr:hypothetical protein [Bacteroidales bacterium]